MGARLLDNPDWDLVRSSNLDRVCVSNLHVLANTGYDAWSRQKRQPIDISVTLHLRHSISSAASSDELDQSTVHYGNLSKSVLQMVETASSQWLDVASFTQDLIDAVPIVNVAFTEVTICMSKATLVGDGVAFSLLKRQDTFVEYSMMELLKLRLPALIGVNEHERTMKQTVVVSVAFQRTEFREMKGPCEAEQIISKTVEESSFRTLESLAESIAARLVKHYLCAYLGTKAQPLPAAAGVRVTIEKPIAVIQADAPSISIYRSANPNDDFAKRMLAELGNKNNSIPFPLEGRLDDFLRSRKQD
ncbi:MAG: hypothetical protein M1828_005139 [Chrysothrix sp. TS-e1954]|nr:MAG: hypothetical protein M1828_005139 [Chrysothrix sp. TS-e1954]